MGNGARRTRDQCDGLVQACRLDVGAVGDRELRAKEQPDRFERPRRSGFPPARAFPQSPSLLRLPAGARRAHARRPRFKLPTSCFPGHDRGVRRVGWRPRRVSAGMIDSRGCSSWSLSSAIVPWVAGGCEIVGDAVGGRPTRWRGKVPEEEVVDHAGFAAEECVDSCSAQAFGVGLSLARSGSCSQVTTNASGRSVRSGSLRGLTRGLSSIVASGTHCALNHSMSASSRRVWCMDR